MFKRLACYLHALREKIYAVIWYLISSLYFNCIFSDIEHIAILSKKITAYKAAIY